MRPAVDEFRGAVNATPIKPMQFPVVSNVTARPLGNEAAIRAEMLAQLTSPVEWVKSIAYMRAHGVDQFFEIGPKDVLAGLIRRITPEARAFSLGDGAAIKAVREGAPA
jgi:[acyl-carrier-protein] S-malonyltransferase